MPRALEKTIMKEVSGHIQSGMKHFRSVVMLWYLQEYLCLHYVNFYGHQTSQDGDLP